MSSLDDVAVGNVDAHLALVARHGLTDGGGPGAGEPLADDTFDVLLAAVERNNLVGLMAAALADGSLPATPAQSLRAKERHRVLAVHAAFVDRLLLTHLPVLEAHPPYAVTKGVAVARLDYEDPGMRLYADVDVLVRDVQLPHLVASLEASGLRRVEPERRPGFDVRFAKDLPLADERGRDLDLHRTVLAGPLGRGLDVDHLCRGETQVMTVAGHPVRAAPRPARYVHACLHALGSLPVRLGDLRDLVQIDRGTLSLAEVLAIADTPARRGAVAWATAIAGRTIGGPSSALRDWARAHRPTAAARRQLRPYLRAGDRASTLALATVLDLPWRDRPAYVRGIIRPQRAFLESRRRTAGSWLLEGVRRARP